MPRPRLTQNRDDLRQTVLQVATDLVAEQGRRGLQARLVAERSGCAVGTLYNLFGDLDGLLLAVNASTLVRLDEAVRGAVARSRGVGPDARLKAFAGAYLAFVVEHEPAWRAVFQHRLGMAGEAPDWYVAHEDALFALVAEALEPLNLKPRRRAVAARAVFAALHGVVALGLGEGNDAPGRSALARTVRDLAGWLARGLSEDETA